jgi:phosphohistidine phosphatase
MDIYLLRHAIAAPLDEDNHFEDAERALTPAGSKKMHDASLGLKELNPGFELVASSPMVRARETAEIVAEVLKFKDRIQLWEELAPGAPMEAILRRLQDLQDNASALLVGHQPDLGSLASYLIYGSDQISLALKKGGLCRIEVTELSPQSRGNLLWMLPPKILRMIGGQRTHFRSSAV